MIPKTSTLLLLGSTLTLLIPPVVFLAVGLHAGMGPGETVQALVEQVAARRQNLAVVTALGLVPLALLAALLWVWGRIAGRPPSPSVALAGLLPVLLVQIWTHLSFWPIFLPSRTYPGFPHGLEFVLAPFVFAPVAMVVCLVVAGLAARFGNAPTGSTSDRGAEPARDQSTHG